MRMTKDNSAQQSLYVETLPCVAGRNFALLCLCAFGCGLVSAGILEEVIVTAQKRSESINEVPLSIQAFTGETLKQLGITDTRDLQAVVPGFTYSDSGVNTPVYTLRGVGFNDTTYNATPTVGIYVDEVSLPYSIMTKGPNTDMLRIEVLKGPQGLLYGRNSTGGAINYITNIPGEQFEAGISATYGRFETADIEGFVSGPITDTIGGRLAVRSIRASEGYQKSHTRPNDTLGEVDKLSWRGMLEWDASDSLRFAFTVSGWEDHSDASAAQAIYLNAGPVLPAQQPHPRISGYPYISPDSTDNRSADWDPHTDWKLNDRFSYAALRTEWDLSDNTNMVVLLNHGSVQSDGSKIPQSGVDVYNAEVNITAEIEFTAIEARLDGAAFDDKLQWMVGANRADDDTDIDYFILMDTGTGQSPWGPPTENSPYGVGFLGNRGAGLSSGDSYSKSVFANVDWDFAEAFKLHLGARYTEDSRSSSACIYETLDSEGTLGFAVPITALSLLGRAQAGLLLPPPPIVKGDCATVVVDEDYVTERPEDTGNGTPEPLWEDELKENNLAYKVGVDWLPEFGLIYASYIRGYKSGSYPLLAATTSTSFEPATQERLDAYEIGAKIGFLDDTLQTNAAVFYYDYKDKQLMVRTPDPIFGPLPVLRNAPESKVEGVELSVGWQATGGLYLSLAGSYIDSEVQKFTGFGFANGQPTDFAGSAFNFSPKVQVNGLVNYTLSLSSSLDLNLGASWSRTGETNSTLEGDSRFHHPQYDLYGATVALSDVEGRWRLTAFGRNITDELGVISIFTTGDIIARRVIAPRTYGLTFEYNYF